MRISRTWRTGENLVEGAGGVEGGLRDLCTLYGRHVYSFAYPFTAPRLYIRHLFFSSHFYIYSFFYFIANLLWLICFVLIILESSELIRTCLWTLRLISEAVGFFLYYLFILIFIYLRLFNHSYFDALKQASLGYTCTEHVKNSPVILPYKRKVWDCYQPMNNTSIITVHLPSSSKVSDSLPYTPDSPRPLPRSHCVLLTRSPQLFSYFVFRPPLQIITFSPVLTRRLIRHFPSFEWLLSFPLHSAHYLFFPLHPLSLIFLLFHQRLPFILSHLQFSLCRLPPPAPLPPRLLPSFPCKRVFPGKHSPCSSNLCVLFHIVLYLLSCAKLLQASQHSDLPPLIFALSTCSLHSRPQYSHTPSAFRFHPSLFSPTAVIQVLVFSFYTSTLCSCSAFLLSVLGFLALHLRLFCFLAASRRHFIFQVRPQVVSSSCFRPLAGTHRSGVLYSLLYLTVTWSIPGGHF